jgi:predicted SnoaL-like aldol condensation-catalyzing enzyme
MSLDEIETRYCQFVEEVINHHHLERLSCYLSQDVIEHAPDVPLGLAGTHQGQFLDVVATGERVTFSAFEAWRLRDGQCVEHWLQLDLLSLLHQLGAEPRLQREPAVQGV